MSTSRKVVVVTGASRGMGAAIVQAFRELDCAVVATSRSIEPSDDANLLTVAVTTVTSPIVDFALSRRTSRLS